MAIGVVGWERGHQDLFVCIACGMAERSLATEITVTQVVRINGAAKASRHEVEVEQGPQLPRDDVVGARAVTGHSKTTQQSATCAVYGEATSKHVYASNLASNHGVVLGADLVRVASVGDVGVHGVGELQTKQRTSVLGQTIEVGSGDGKAAETEGVGSICFLGRDDPTSRPLVASFVAREGHCLHDAITINHGGPHVEVESRVVLSLHRLQSASEIVKGGQSR